MAFTKDDRVRCKRKLVFGSELELPKGSEGTVVGAGPIRVNVDFDDDDLVNYRRIDNGDLTKIT